MGRDAAARTAPAARRRHYGLSRLGASRAPASRRRNERAPARDGNDAEFRSMQPWPTDLRRAEAQRYRTAFWQTMTLPDEPRILELTMGSRPIERLFREHHLFRFD